MIFRRSQTEDDSDREIEFECKIAFANAERPYVMDVESVWRIAMDTNTCVNE